MSITEVDHLVFDCTVGSKKSASQRQRSERTQAMLDSGATTNFIDARFLKEKGLTTCLRELPKVRSLTLADGHKTEITHCSDIDLVIGQHYEATTCIVVPQLNYPLILGIAWMTQHNIQPDFRARSITFRPSSCPGDCLPCRQEVTVYSSVAPVHCLPKTEINGIQISAISISELCEDLQTDGGIEAAVVLLPAGQAELSCCTVRQENFEKFMTGKKTTDPASKVPPEYHEFLEIFSKPASDVLPPHRPGVDHEIKLTVSDQDQLPHKKTYGMTQQELAAAKTYIDEHLEKGFIRPSTSPITSPVLLVKKPSGGLRFCVDYRAVNAITIKNRYPIPRIRETLDRLCKARYFMKLDIIAAFNRIRIAEGEEWKTAFVTRFG
jgi:hypothetical protein